MKIILREQVPDDIGWLILMHGLLYSKQFNFDSQFEVDIAKKVISFFEEANDFDTLWIAQIESDRVGSIAVSIKSDQTAFVNFLLVKAKYRGHGVASKLIDKVIAHTEENGLKILRLETYSCLEDARKLYKKYGFKPYKKNASIEKYGQIFDQEFWEKRI